MKFNALRLITAGLAGESPGLAALVVKLQGCEINHELAALAIDALGELGVLYEDSPHLRANGSWQQRYMFDLGLIIGGGTAQASKNPSSPSGWPGHAARTQDRGGLGRSHGLRPLARPAVDAGQSGGRPGATLSTGARTRLRRGWRGRGAGCMERSDRPGNSRREVMIPPEEYGGLGLSMLDAAPDRRSARPASGPGAFHGRRRASAPGPFGRRARRPSGPPGCRGSRRARPWPASPWPKRSAARGMGRA